LELALLPGVEGYFGVKANHVPTIAQLQPGVVELHDGAEISKYFVSGGFAFVHPNSVTDICVLEAATLDQFDSTAVKQALQVRNGSIFYRLGRGRYSLKSVEPINSRACGPRANSTAVKQALQVAGVGKGTVNSIYAVKTVAPPPTVDNITQHRTSLTAQL
jgi:hypothetical protein